MRISKNFTLTEFEYSDTAKYLKIDNRVVDTEHLLNIAGLVHNVLQPIRDRFGSIVLSSGYRSPELNKAVGGASDSQHSKGEACDFRATKKMFNWIRDNIEFDQLINELPNEDGTPRWIHISFKTNGKNRGEVLRFDGNRYYKI